MLQIQGVSTVYSHFQNMCIPALEYYAETQLPLNSWTNGKNTEIILFALSSPLLKNFTSIVFWNDLIDCKYAELSQLRMCPLLRK